MATILIVDDLAANRTILVTLLQSHGHRVLEAANGSEALALVRAEHLDLVITDVLMPLMDGYEFVRQLRVDPATSHIPVVFCTAHYGEREARELALAGGVHDVLTKPLQSAEVLRIVNLMLAGEARTQVPSDPEALTTKYCREHLRLLTDKLSSTAGDLRIANARLRALINIGLELASEQDSHALLSRVCAAALDLFGATYTTLGIVDQNTRTLRHVVTCGTGPAEWIKVGDSVSGMLGRVITEGRTFRADGDLAVLEFPAAHPPVQAFLAAPISSPAFVYGWICLVGNENRTFTDDDEQLVIALAGHVGRIYEGTYFRAVALERSRALGRETLERQQADSARRHERDRAQLYLDTAQVILLSLDTSGRVMLVNRFACSVLGWTEEELVGRDFIETCMPAGIREETRRKLGTVLAGPDSSIVESAIVTRSGEERTVEWRNTLLRDDQGRVVSTLSSGTDVTERNQAIEALRTGEGRMRFALQSANVGIWDMDYSAGTLQWSETLEAHYGLRPGTFGGTFHAFLDLVHPDDRGCVIETFEKAAASGADFVVEHRALWPDGTVRRLTGAGRIHMDAHGAPVRGVGISLDVTERRALEAQSQQAQKLEAIGRLAGGVAHDFNNMLTAILGYCDLLLDDVGVGDPYRADIEEIQKAGVSAAGLTRQLLAFSRKEIIDPTLLDLNAVVSGMQAMLGRLIREDVKVVLHLRPELAPVKADRSQMEQIVLNLVLNARDAMPKGGTMTVQTGNVDLDDNFAKSHLAARPGPYAVLTVSDTGTGISPAVKARLFEPFFTTKELGSGTGLGLATVDGIVARSGGFISVYSEMGRGTSFKVYFPRAEGAGAVGDESPHVSHSHSAVETVLIVEDEDALRELARRQLERQGYTVLLAANADQALRLFNENASIDALLTDVVMPGGNGPELTRQLMAQRPALKVVYMSGYTEEAIVHFGVLKPGVAFVQKPFTAETLGRKLREVLDRVSPETALAPKP